MAGVTQKARVADQLLELHNLVSENKDFNECCKALKEGDPASFDSVWGSSCALLVAALQQRFKKLLVVCPDEKSADNLLDDFSTFSKSTIAKFPILVDAAESRVTVDYEYSDRLRVLKNCMAGSAPDAIIAPAAALMQSVPSSKEICLLYTSPSPRDKRQSRMPSSA